MTARLLIIDPQNDFCDIPGAALPVSGANSDMQRLAGLIDMAGPVLGDIIVTLDSHPMVAIERPTFWQKADGSAVSPFTQITAAEVQAGKFLPRNTALLTQTLAYLRALEAGGKYNLMVWPVHCVLGTWGHNIQADVARALAHWEVAGQKEVAKVLKGLNAMTEQYSAVAAEVPRDDDERTQPNTQLVERVYSGEGLILIAGEASSHCVAATMTHIFEFMTAPELARVVILRDCMSPVGGFEDAQTAFFTRCELLGARVMTATEAQALLAV